MQRERQRLPTDGPGDRCRPPACRSRSAATAPACGSHRRTRSRDRPGSCRRSTVRRRPRGDRPAPHGPPQRRPGPQVRTRPSGPEVRLGGRDPATVTSSQRHRIAHRGQPRRAHDRSRRVRSRAAAPRGAPSPTMPSSVSSHPHDRYRFGSPRSATIALTTDEPPRPRPRRYGRAVAPAVRVAEISPSLRSARSAAAKKLSASTSGGTAPATRSGPDSTSTTRRSGSSERRAATTHPADPAPTTIHAPATPRDYERPDVAIQDSDRTDR